MPSPSSPESSDRGSVGRELVKRIQELMERVTSAAPSEAAILGQISGQLRSVIDASAAMSAVPARQMQVIVDSIRTQRRQIEGLQQQLQSFSDQLGMLESALAPALDMSAQWAKAQQAMSNKLRPRGDS